MLSLNSRRQSGIELLKIIALFGIVLCHTYTSFSIATNGTTNTPFFDDNAFGVFEYFIFQIIITLGYVGNNIFFVCSAWFLVDSKKNKIEKLLHMIISTFLISIVYLLIYFLSGKEVSNEALIQSIFPITTESYWYVTYYVVFYAIYPLLNTIINKLDERKHFIISTLIFIVFFIFVYFTGIGAKYINKLVSFILIYFIVSYVKKYKYDFCENIKANLIVFFLSGIAFYSIIFINFAIKSINIDWHVLYNPFFLLISISLLNLFRKMDIKNVLINTVSALSLYIYVIHNNFLFVQNTLNNVSALVMMHLGVECIVVKILATALLLFVFSASMSLLYYSIFNKFVSNVSMKIKNTLLKMIN